MFELLPTSVVSCILSEWTDMKDLVYLDSACCRADIRAQLLHIMQSPGIIFSPTEAWYRTHNASTQSIKWMLQKSIKVSFLKIWGGGSMFETFLRTSGHCISELIFTNFPDSLPESADRFGHILEGSIGVCSNLVKLGIFHSPLQFRSIQMIARLRKLKYLSITPAERTTTMTEQFEKRNYADFAMPSLKSIRVSTGEYRSVPSTTLFDIVQLGQHHLAHLELRNFNEQAISELQCCPNLRALSLPNTDMPDNIHEIARCCPLIAHLAIDGFWVGGGSDSLVTLFQRLSLRSLCVNHTHLSDVSIRGMCELSNTVQELYMVDTTGHSDIAVYMEVFTACTKLHTLCLSASDFFDLYINSDNGGEMTSMHNITTLILHLSKTGSDASAISVINILCPSITALYLTHLDGGIVEEVVDLVRKCSSFRALHVRELRDKDRQILKMRAPVLKVHGNPHEARFEYDALSYVLEV